MTRPNTQQIKQIIGNNKIVFIDEAQRIPEIGLTSKIIVDKFKDVQLILSGSSSFDLYSKVNEPLTGRKWTFSLWPITWEEWQNHVGYVRAEQDVGILWENFLVSERVKQISQNKDLRQYYFWRTAQQQEVDYVEEINGRFFGYEFKWSERKTNKFPKTFTNGFDSVNDGINRSNFRDFVYIGE